MSPFLISSILTQPQSMAHPTLPDSPLFFPTIHERPMSFSPPPTFSSPKMPITQRRKSTSVLESQARNGQPHLRTVGPSPLPPGMDCLNRRSDGMTMLGKPSVRSSADTNHRHQSFDGQMFVDGRPGTVTDAHVRPVEAVYLAGLPYNPQAEAFSTTTGPGHVTDPMLGQLGSVYDYQTGQSYIARPVQSLRLETGLNQPSPLGSMSAPVTSDPHIMLHQVFVPQSAPPILSQGSEGHQGCVFEFHVHSAGPEGAVYLPHRVFRTRRGSAELEEVPHSSLLQSRLQTVTEEQSNQNAPEPVPSLTGAYRCNGLEGSSEYSSDSSQRNSSDPGDYLSPPPAASSEISVMYTQKLFQEPHVFFCFPQPGAVYNQQVTRQEFIISVPRSFTCRP
ncbi:uncharacterized protein LOC142153228 [Mixophyes fleayi]|uniref:uncharacterized protein LOC142153228 n=1 Tax=Mixophyes fleayi TaxID=3061075 RepID=UPI003F4D94AB